MVALDVPLHGYAIMQKVEAISEGSVVIGPGTLYGAFTTLEKQGLIDKVSEEERRKTYALTDKGRRVLAEHVRRLAIMVHNGQLALSILNKGAVI
ncbi:PadR family transcriptional regulator [Massilia glaciei]|uniref:PadR family transcriptional regulator n=2 Tax=Massilia glaciei TaxID=1524097 RepID=A0A2U2HFI7_9BURK|nr:PadR family transcriptional regulator [Massilia glaciei]